MSLISRLIAWTERAAGPPGAEYHVVRGIPVTIINSRPDITTPFAIGRLDAALGLIDQYQPWRGRHLRRDIARIWIRAYPSRGVYFPVHRAILTELSFLGRHAEFSVAQVASSLLHEGVHARVHEMGVHLRFDLATRDMAREERLCRRAEIAFGEALPAPLGAPVITRAAEALALPDEGVAPEVDWQAAAAAKDQADREAIASWRRSQGL